MYRSRFLTAMLPFLFASSVAAQNIPRDSLAALALSASSEYLCTFNTGVRVNQKGGVAEKIDVRENVLFIYKADGMSRSGTLRGVKVVAHRASTSWGYTVQGDGDSARDSNYTVRVFPVFFDSGRSLLTANLQISEQSLDLMQRETTVMTGSCTLK